VREQIRSVADTRSRRAPGWLDKPGTLRSLDVCLDSRGPFIDAVSAISALNESLRPLPALRRLGRRGSRARSGRIKRRAREQAAKVQLVMPPLDQSAL
jgi:hypothetical protein